MNLPNWLTVGRLVMVPVFVALMYLDSAAALAWAAAVFALACITDFLDGHLARAWNQITTFGKLLDPIADKVLVASAFIMMMETPELRVPGWAVIIVLGREFLVSGMRALVASEGAVLPANRVGKVKAVLQMVFVMVFLVLGALVRADRAAMDAGQLAGASWWAALGVAAFTLYSGIQFVAASRSAIAAQAEQEA